MNEQKMLSDEDFALMESSRTNVGDAYFNPRPHLKTEEGQRVFDAAFERGYRAALTQPNAGDVVPDGWRLVPDGWVLVPVEPTEAMVSAMQETWFKLPSAHCMKTTDTYRLHAAMLAAAPNPIEQSHTDYTKLPIGKLEQDFAEAKAAYELALSEQVQQDGDRLTEDNIIEMAVNAGFAVNSMGRLIAHTGIADEYAYVHESLRNFAQLVIDSAQQPTAQGSEAVYQIRNIGGNWLEATKAEYDRWVFPEQRRILYTKPQGEAVDELGNYQPLITRAKSEWQEDDGPVMWWAWCGHKWAGEPAWCGSPTDSDWPGYHTHWTPHPPVPAEALAKVNDK